MSSGSDSTDSVLEKEIIAYNAMKETLEKEHMGEWVIFYAGKLKGTYPTFEDAADYAIKEFGRGPYLIRQVGERPVVLPVSVVYSVSRNAG